MTRSNQETTGRAAEAASPRNTRNGLLLFAAYLTLYGSFVLLSAFVPSFMEREMFDGINWAVASGLSLIVGAFALSLVYAWLCRSPLSVTVREDRR